MWWEGTSGGLPCNLVLTIDSNSSGQLWFCLAKLKYLMDGEPMTSVGSLCQRFSFILLGKIPSHKYH